MLRVEDVLRVIERETDAIEPREVELGEALGGVLAEGVIMDVDSPAFDRAMVDGYALRGVDGAVGAELRVIGHVDAGVVFAGVVGAGECVGINTGAVMPTGADAVLMVEHSEAAEVKSESADVRRIRALRCQDGGWDAEKGI